MSYVNEKKCMAAGIDIAKIKSIANRLSKAGKDAKKLGIVIFGGSGSGSLRIRETDSIEYGSLILADLDGNFDGVAGINIEDDDGLLRGE